MEWKLFSGDKSEYASLEWYADREAAHHLEQDDHGERLRETAKVVKIAIDNGAKTLVDLGCGDGGLLQLLKDENLKSWGYDLMQSNIDYAINVRKVDARYTDFNSDDSIEYGDISVFAEVLEHMEDPHKVLKNLNSKYVIASSPYNENDLNHYEFHLWAWDQEGYKKLLENNGYKVVYSTTAAGWSQILLGIKN
jgi:predicted TPR repeat methyltransferase